MLAPGSRAGISLAERVTGGVQNRPKNRAACVSSTSRALTSVHLASVASRLGRVTIKGNNLEPALEFQEVPDGAVPLPEPSRRAVTLTPTSPTVLV